MADCIYIRLYVLSIAVLVTVLSPPRCAAADAGSIKLPKKIAVIAKSDSDIRGHTLRKVPLRQAVVPSTVRKAQR